MKEHGWRGHGRGSDEQVGADHIAELSKTERHTKRRRDGHEASFQCRTMSGARKELKTWV